ncbi:DUF2695 domain-containing protein [Spirosoma radiotolerans]|uniref:DUF2695 domain-containing protein n=1 Tax=Spirosoma radiotolerans TaxID=1379870 RepID=A0A0E3V5Q8_9BACT|nr:DUF2695 domain-containing protein [Spirosoma radiotolerans]AKD53861.1 hypothetical protein SD10_02015 [Spirosoma radiotolerans]
MASKEDKQKRKQLLQEFKDKEQEAKSAQMPISKAELKDLFVHLDSSLQEEDCDDSLTLTEAFLLERHLPVDQTKAWLAQYGGYCDCEVLANVEDEFPKII